MKIKQIFNRDLVCDLKGSVWESGKLILSDGPWFPETADVIFFSEKIVF